MQSNVHLSRSKAPFALLVALFLALALAGPAQAIDSASDSTSEPQPVSNADSNDGGANGQCTDEEADSEGDTEADTESEGEGPYCSTRDGSASENGKGDGAATGKDCAGCRGKADNKNPPGQNPDASDGNNGYECDGNQGIAQGNPAHTACVDAETTTSDEPDSSDETDDTGKPDEPGNSDKPDGAGVELEAPSTVAGGEIAGVELGAQPNTNQATAAAAQAARTAPMGLPQTGASDSLLMLLLAGLAMAGIGGTTMLYRRRTASNN